MHEAAFSATIAAALTSLPIARQRPMYRPVCVFLWYLVISGLCREQLVGRIVLPAKEAARAAGLDPLAASYPAHVLAAAHVDHALHVAALLGVTVVAAATLMPEEGRRVGARSFVMASMIWVLVTAIQVLSFPQVRGHRAEIAFYLPVGVFSVVASTLCAVAWALRRTSPQIEHVAVLLLVVIDAVITLAIFDRSGARWGLALGACLVAYSALTLLQGVWLWWRSSSRAS